MSNAILIGICGPARAGKDTAADHLVNEYGFYRHSMAGPLKTMLAAGFGLTWQEIHGEHKEAPLSRLGLDKSPRQLMQSLGTEWGRDCVDTEVWLKLAATEWARCKLDGCGMVIPDVRFENEAAFVREHGVLIHISRDDCQKVAAHSSENGIYPDSADWEVVNDCSIAQLHRGIGMVYDFVTAQSAA